MQTSVDAPVRGRRWLRWLAPLLVLAAVAVAVLVRMAGSSGASDNPAAESEPATLPEQLAARVVEILEESSVSEHAEHGHEFSEAAAGIVCGAETLGFDPPEATTVAQVEVVYARHMCAEAGTGYGWPEAVRAAGPLAVELTEPATVRLPEQALPNQPDAAYADRIRAIIPERYHEQALAGDGFTDPAVTDELRDRFEKRSG